MDYVIILATSLGLVLGFRHATDADHLAAISTIISERRGLLASAMVGLSWRIGHSITLFLISIQVLVFRLTVPDSLGAIAEVGVGAILVIPGLLALHDIGRKRIHVHAHNHDTVAHLHFHSHLVATGHQHKHGIALRPRSVLIGLFQGTAGSAALMVFVLTTLDSAFAGILYVAAYDLAVMLGILIFSIAIGLPFTVTYSRFPLFSKGLRLTTALASIIVGMTLAWGAMFE